MVWAPEHLFGGPHATHLVVFEGGTSLSKACGVIRRFSEGVDLTYDIRVIGPDLIGDAATPLPATKSQEKKWSKAIRERLAKLVTGTLAPQLMAALQDRGLPAKARVENALLTSTTNPSPPAPATSRPRSCWSSVRVPPVNPTSSAP